MSENFALLVVVPFLAVIFGVTYFPVWKMRRRGRYTPLVENRLRLPGDSTRAALSDLFANLAAMYFALFLSMMSTLFFLSKFGYVSSGALIVIIIGLGLFYYVGSRIYKIFVAAKNHQLGIEAEEYTGQELNLLQRYGAYVFHDIPYKYGNIDHVLIGYDKIFAIETKGVSKPGGASGQKEGQMRYDGKWLIFPHFTTDKPIKQAECHANYLTRIVDADTKCTIPVIPVVALPGWYVDSTAAASARVQVINPKRGKFLRRQIGDRRQCEQFELAVKTIEQLARASSPLASVTDPDASEHYNLWTNKPKEVPRR